MSIKACLAAAVAAVLVAGSASALVVQSQSGVMTRDGQDFRFDFATLAPGNGTGAVLTIASGPSTTGSALDDGFDIDGRGIGGANEFFSVSADGTDLGAYSCGGRSGQSIPGFSMNGNADCRFSLDLALGPAEFAEKIADGVVSVLVAFSRGVGHFGDGDRLDVTLRYDDVVPAPLPAAGLMLVGALGALGVAARRRRSKAV